VNLLQYSLLLLTGTAIAWSSFFFVLFGIDPLALGAIGVLLFYVTAFASLAGTFTSFATLIRAKHAPHRPIEHLVSTSFRQAFLFSSLILLSLFLLSQESFTALNMILLIVVLGAIEGIYLFFLEKKTPDSEE
jgi:hypothetical protein